MDIGNCLASKTTLTRQRLLKNLPCHQNINRLVVELHDYWVDRYQLSEVAEQERMAGVVGNKESLSESSEEEDDFWTTPTARSYDEHSDEQWFKKVFRLLHKAKRTIPVTTQEVLQEKTNLVLALYPFLKSSRSKATTSN